MLRKPLLDKCLQRFTQSTIYHSNLIPIHQIYNYHLNLNHNQQQLATAPRISIIKPKMIFDSVIGIDSQMGKRQSNEDRTMHGMFNKINHKDNNQSEMFYYFGVFDGFGGDMISEYFAQNFGPNIDRALMRWNGDQPLESLLVEVIHETEDKYLQNADTSNNCGCTAVVCLMHKNILITANVGDSRAVLCKKGRAIALTRDHKPSRDSENARVSASGGNVVVDTLGTARVMGILSMSRSLGLTSFRHYGVINEPDVETYHLNDEEDGFIILGSDGLFDKVTNQEAVDLVKMYKTPLEAAKSLNQLSLNNDSSDNTTSVVIRLKGWNRFRDVNYSGILKKLQLHTVFGKTVNSLPDFITTSLSSSTDEGQKEQLMAEIFNLFDSSETGRLSPSDIKAGMKKLGRDLLDDEIEFILMWADTDGNGVISKEEFIHCFSATSALNTF